jgi:tripartite-type tricarboxylate transporter receptor subunit TctC
VCIPESSAGARTTPEELERQIKSEIARWSAVIKAQSIEAE